jgi:hypothetical protein
LGRSIPSSWLLLSLLQFWSKFIVLDHSRPFQSIRVELCFLVRFIEKCHFIGSEDVEYLNILVPSSCQLHFYVMQLKNQANFYDSLPEA